MAATELRLGPSTVEERLSESPVAAACGFPAAAAATEMASSSEFEGSGLSSEKGDGMARGR